MTIFVIFSNKSRSKYSSSQARCKLYKTKNEKCLKQKMSFKGHLFATNHFLP